MKKKIAVSLFLVFSIFLLSGCGGKGNDSKTTNNAAGAKTTTEGLCGVFTKESVASITGLDIASTDIYSAEGSNNSNCRYYTSVKRYAPTISIGKYQGDAAVEKNKYTDGKSFKGWKTGTDKQITMNHFIAYNQNGNMNDIFLITGKGEYYRISLHSLNVIKNEQMIKLASQVAQKISENK